MRRSIESKPRRKQNKREIKPPLHAFLSAASASDFQSKSFLEIGSTHARDPHHVSAILKINGNGNSNYYPAMPDSKRVIPLESNPEIFNSLAQKIGLTPVLFFHDVYSLSEPDLVALLPQPVMAVIMLFPITKGYEEYRKQEDSKSSNSSDKVVWFKQTIGNGCGLYALLHALSNIQRDFIIENSTLSKLVLQQLSPSMSNEEKAKLVEALEQNIQLDENYGSQGQTEAPEAEESVEYHFITFARGSDGHLYELDGRRTGPVDLGEAHETHIVVEPALIEKIQFYMDNTDEDQRNNFALMALAPAI